MPASLTFPADPNPNTDDHDERTKENLHVHHKMCNLVVMVEIIYFHQALKNPDSGRFVQGNVKGFN